MPQKPSRLLDEIKEQPQALRLLLDAFPQNFEGIALPGYFTQKLFGIGEGSSFNAIKIAAPFIEEFTGLNTFTFDPESLDNKFEVAESLDQPIKRLFERSFFLAVSQSGQTGSILKIVGKLQETLGFSDRYSPLVPFTNNPQGTLGSRYGNHFYLNAGAEESIAATKSMTASIMALLLFGIKCGQKRAWLRRPVYQEQLAVLNEIPDRLEQFLTNDALHRRINLFAQSLADSNQFVVLSKGILSSILPEIALKLTETSQNIVSVNNTETFKHGHKVILHGIKGQRPNCVYLIPPNLDEKSSEQLFSDIYSHFYTGDEQTFRTDRVFFVRFENSPEIPDDIKKALHLKGSEVLTLPPSQGIESLFMGIVAFQLVSYYLALAKGEDPNNPALQKAVLR